MLTDIQRAMLGDHEAAARLAEQGVLIPLIPWNTRAPILSAEEMEMLEGDEMSRYDVLFMNGKSLMFWALEWFSMSNDAFFACYGFNFNPHNYPGLYEQARARYFSKEGQP